ncbi:MAG: HAD hydrolase-like protein [Calditrichia bacterium]
MERSNNFRYSHIIWDWNGTLFDDARLCIDVMNELLEKRNLPALSPQRYQEIFGFPVIDYYRRAGFDFSAEPFEKISTEFITAYEARRRTCGLRPDVREVLRAGRQRGLSQSILSASRQDYLVDAVAQFRLGEMFDKILGLDNHHAYGKTGIGRKWIGESGLDKGTILLVGDTLHDFEVARELGIDCCLIPGGHQSYERLAACGVKMLRSLSGLYD